MEPFELFANHNEPIWADEQIRHWVEGKGGEMVVATVTTEEEIVKAARNADIFLVRPGIQMTRSVISSLPKLKLLMSASSGYDHIDDEAATENRVLLTNTPRCYAVAVAEFTFALIMACGRRIVRLDRDVRQGVGWQAQSAPPHRLVGQAVGLVGLGRIGQGVVWRARGCGLEVLAYDPYIPTDQLREKGAEPVELEELLQRSDYVSLHAPLNDETRHSFGDAQLKLMKPTAHLINTCRGPVVDEAALIRALEEGWIAGAGLDVLDQEPPSPDNPLLHMDNVIITGHQASQSMETPQEWLNEVLEVLVGFVAGRWPINVVNPDVQPKIDLK